MKISDLYKRDKIVVSFEVFPPKKDSNPDIVYNAIHNLSILKPDFISVTYGAGGTQVERNLTSKIAEHIKLDHNTEALAHLTCSGMTEASFESVIADFKTRGIENILALRGDNISLGIYRYARDLIHKLKDYGFCIGAAAYPEGHIACEDIAADLDYLKQKQDSGADFFITQLFFSNDIFYRFIDNARAKGVTVPVSAGVMPILSRQQLQRMIFMCGASLPSPIIKLINRYGEEGDSLVKAGIEYSYRQMQDLSDHGVEGIHIYTMNKPFIAEYCVNNLRL